MDKVFTLAFILGYVCMFFCTANASVNKFG